LKKRIFWILGILIIVLIGSLWIIEKKDKHALELAKTEARATKVLFEQAKQSYDILLTYKGEEIPEDVHKLAISSLKTADDLYGTTMAALDLIHENYRASETFGGIRQIINILLKESITYKDFDLIPSYLSQIEDVVEMTDRNLYLIEKKINNYWWK
jgi:hypothetical protein